MIHGSAVERLNEALTLLADRDQRTPCGGRDRDRWTSDSTADQEFAAAACAPCPLLDQCAAAARELRVVAGVWAGVPHDLKTYTKPRKAVA
jgi:hypothetical protein